MACPAGHQPASSLSLHGWWPAGEGHGMPAWLLPSLVNWFILQCEGYRALSGLYDL